MFTLSITSHKEASDELLHKVICIKSVAWPYPEVSQLIWINDNMKPDDLHCILFENYKPIGYLNLINEKLNNDSEDSIPIWGIGNVCVVEKGKGYGGILLLKVNEYIIQTNRIGLLFCHDKLVDFYKKHGWKLNHTLMSLQNGIHIMTFNFVENINYKYTGTYF